jgi:hypothetical protein
VAGRHRTVAGDAPQQPLQERPELVADRCATRSAVAPEGILNLLEDARIDDRRLFAIVDFGLVTHLAGVDDVGEQVVQGVAVERLTAPLRSFARLPPLGLPPAAVQLLDRWQQRAVFEVKGEDLPHPFGFLGIDRQPISLGVNVVAQHRVPAGPLALAPGSRNLVAGAFPDDLTLELGEAEKDVQDQSAHRSGGVKLLSDTDKGDLLLLEGLHHLGEVEKTAGEAVYLVDHHTVDLAGRGVGQETLQTWSIGVAAGVPTVVIAVRENNPTLPGLTADEGFTGLAKRIATLIETTPSTPEAFRAIRNFATAVQRPGPLPDIATVATALQDRAAVGESVRRLLSAIVATADAMLAAGTANDADAAIIRLADLRPLRVARADMGGIVLAGVSRLPESHLARSIEPFRLPSATRCQAMHPEKVELYLAAGTPVLVLGTAPGRWMWRSAVDQITKQWRVAQERQEREFRESQAREAAETRQKFELSPAGQQQRLRELEAQVATMKATSAT